MPKSRGIVGAAVLRAVCFVLAPILALTSCGETATSSPAPAASAILAATSPTPSGSSADLRIEATAGKSSVTVRVREQLADVPAPSDAVLTTRALTGQIVLRSDGTFVETSRIVVDLATLQSNRSLHDNFIKRSTLETARFPTATFVPKRADGLPAPLPANGEWIVTLVGDMTVHGVTKEIGWNAMVRRAAIDVSGTALTNFKFGDFGMTRPSVVSVLSIVDDIRLEIDFVGSVTA